MTWFPGWGRNYELWSFANFKGGSSVQQQPVTQTSKTVSEPWSAQKPFLKRGFEAAEQEILNNPLQFFPGQTFVDFSPQTQQALSLMESRALGGSPLVQNAQGQLQDTLSGRYLENPNMGAITDAVTSAVRPQVDSAFAGANRFGSPLHAEAMARGISRGVAPYAFDDYRRGRTEMERASMMAPQLANQDYYDLGQLASVGQAHEDLAGRELADRMARHEFGQTEPYTRLPAYMGLVQGNYGGTSTGTTTGTQFVPQNNFNPLLFGLGAAAMGTNMASQLFGPFGVFS